MYVYLQYYVPFSNKNMVQQTKAFQIDHLCFGMAGTSFVCAHVLRVLFKPISHKSFRVSYYNGYKNGLQVVMRKNVNYRIL